ncbi:MAG TPA: hypothetical protein VN943_19965 [Candidatus Acidoferrum sp.]|nr:hypothetical protein [Candidatus Acidoferrum sp.]
MTASAGDGDFASIEWLKFTVELQVPCGFASASGSDLTVDATKCAGERKKHFPGATSQTAATQTEGKREPAEEGKGIRAANLTEFLSAHYGEVQPDLTDLETECGEGQKPIRSLPPFQYADLDGDGQEEAVYEGFTCMSGTAGVDFFGVLKMMPDDQIIALPIEGERKQFKGRQNLYGGLRGHIRLEIRNGRLLEIYPVYTDENACNNCAEGGEREFGYRWDGHQFVLDDIIDVPPAKGDN